MVASFKAMLNLKKLRSVDDAEDEGYSPGPMIDCLCQSTFSFEQLSWNPREGRQQLFEQFLPNQQRLQYLHLPYGFDLHPSPGVQKTARILSAGRAAQLSLDSLSGPFSTSVVILSGKSQVKYLRWTPGAEFLLYLNTEQW